MWEHTGRTETVVQLDDFTICISIVNKYARERFFLKKKKSGSHQHDMLETITVDQGQKYIC